MSTRDGDTGDERNPYESASRWRHQESSAFARHAAQASQARDPVQTGDTAPLASFLNSTRIEPEGDSHSGGHFKPITVAAGDASMHSARNNDLRTVEGEAPDGREIVCGPLLNYRRMREGRWHGSVLVVVKGGGKQQLHQPILTIR